MPRMIRTEYITELEKIVAFNIEEGISAERISAMTKIVAQEAKADIEAVSFVYPAIAVVSAGWRQIHVQYKTSPEVEAVTESWNKLYEELGNATSDNRGWTRSVDSFKMTKEDARIQLAWANDLTTATVNLTKENVANLNAALFYIQHH